MGTPGESAPLAESLGKTTVVTKWYSHHFRIIEERERMVTKGQLLFIAADGFSGGGQAHAAGGTGTAQGTARPAPGE